MSAKLALTFSDANGNDVKLNYSHVNTAVEASDVRTLMSTIITNGSIFSSVPAAQKSAKLVITTESDIDLSA